MKKIFIISATVILYFIAIKSAYATGTTVCQPIYGGGQTCVAQGQLLINKKVARPNTDEFVENLEQTDPRFSPEQFIKFQIILTNTGNAVVQKVTVKDVFPASVTSFSGAGTYNANNNTLSFEEANMQPNETRIITLTGKVVTSDKLVDLQCDINQAIATVDGKDTQDNTKFCIARSVLGITTTKGGKQIFPAPSVTTTPKTGPEALALFALIPTGALGHFLKKRSLKSL